MQKLAEGWVYFWVVLAIVSAIADLRTDLNDVPGIGENVAGFANRAGNPDELQIDAPTVGTSGNPIGTAVSYAQNAKDWLVFMARAAALQSSIWEAWTNPFRVFIAVGGFIMLLFIARDSLNSVTNFVGGIFGRTTP